MIEQADVQRLRGRVAHYVAKQSALVNDLRDLEREEAAEVAAHDRADAKQAHDIAQAEHALELLIAKWDRPEMPVRLSNGAYAPPSTTPAQRAEHDERVLVLQDELEQLQRARRHAEKTFVASAKQRVQLRESYERRLDAVAKKLEVCSSLPKSYPPQSHYCPPFSPLLCEKASMVEGGCVLCSKSNWRPRKTRRGRASTGAAGRWRRRACSSAGTCPRGRSCTTWRRTGWRP